MSETTLDIKEVHTQVGNDTLLEDISFSVERGSVMALVGHNGAGKSTLMKTIMGTMEKTDGEIILDGAYSLDNAYIAFKQHIAYIPEEPQLLTELTALQHFQLYGMSYDMDEKSLMDRVERYVEGFSLEGKLHEYPESLSKGMRQKVQTICAFLPDVPLLLIDEPYMGLDVFATDYMETIIEEKLASGASVLLTTHQLERAKKVATDYVMLEGGKMLSTGTIDDFVTITRRGKIDEQGD